ncbi:hypothetical protein HBA55_17855 [Pseudomaricurvus alkylphenolicus]|uniref:hypothetical protein n=1 Tax=Pseudomaricurvus alkylphenolicus TaxID=1306991 RepID=UPI001420A7F1|nr:hypothetical protein [Pseudomaricurvus alkylphenolicus]NIB41472.1 hypothetical protein [Pseudomaricurvus alkylphenolicus]
MNDSFKSDAHKAIFIALSSGKGTRFDICQAILSIIESETDSNVADLLEYTCINFESISSNDTVDLKVASISDKDKEELKASYGKISDEMLASLIDRNLSSEEFYSELWGIISNPFFSNELKRAFVLYNMLMDKRIPYFNVSEGVKMNDDEFRDISASIATEKANVRFLLTRKFKQKTQQASNLLDVLSSVDDIKRKTVLLAYIINEAGTNNADVLRAIQALQKG